MRRSKLRRFNILQSLAVILIALLLVYLEIHVPFFSKGLHASLFVLVVTVAALYGDRVSGIVAVIVCCIAVNYATKPYGFDFGTTTVFKISEFSIESIVIYGLAWWSRMLKAQNVGLVAKTKQLERANETLETTSKKKFVGLLTLNGQLESLIRQFIEDGKYWDRKVPSANRNSILKSVKQRKY
jgi:K+-sensing histidine kinase KdpD